MEIKRNLKTLNNKTGKQIITKIGHMESDHEKYQKAYFWSPPANASGRRSMEFKDSLSFILCDKKYELKQELSCSCKTVYWSNQIFVDGEKKNIKALKSKLKSLRR